MNLYLNISCLKVQMKNHVSSKQSIKKKINILTSSGFRQQQRLIVLQLNTSHLFLSKLQEEKFPTSIKPEKKNE